MPVKMEAHQLAFWQELLSPFPQGLLSTTSRGGKELTYIDKRAITNRLDSVCGPMGWFPEYESTARGYKCRLSILVPTTNPEHWTWMAKEDGAGFEEMGAVNKKTQEWEADVDNDEKSGYTNALRRAAQDAWGIGRYLYGKGIPTFLDPDAQPFEDAGQPSPRPAASKPAPQIRSAQEAEDRRRGADSTKPDRIDPRPTPIMPVGEASSKVAAPPPSAARQYDNFKIPRSGKQVFPWCCEMEKVFETELRKGMAREGENRGWGGKFTDWNEGQVHEICMATIQFLRDMPTYQNQYEYLFPGGAGPQPVQVKPATSGVNIADLRRILKDRMTALISKQTGREPTTPELKSSFENIASSSANSDGHTGEVPESLSKLTDLKWLTNMIAFVDGQIAQAVALPEGEEIPF